MSVTQADLDALDRMIVSGVLAMTYDGKRVEYRSMADLRAARALVAAELASASAAPATAFYLPEYDRGA